MEKDRRKRWALDERHYRTVSQWFERLGLVVVASLVVQKIVSGASLGDPVVVLGVIASFVVYAFAYLLLLKS
jgi:hypothetical protein